MAFIKHQKLKQNLWYSKLGVLAAGLGSLPLIGPNNLNVTAIAGSLVFLAFDRNITKYIKQYQINKTVESNMIYKDIQRYRILIQTRPGVYQRLRRLPATLEGRRD